MSEKNLDGQMNMFELLGEKTVASEQAVIVKPRRLGKYEAEIVVETETEVEPETEVEKTLVTEKKVSDADVVMHRDIKDSAGRVIKSVSYINYNKVKIVTNYDDEKLYSFESSKEAVDFYIDKMQNLKKL